MKQHYPTFSPETDHPQFWAIHAAFYASQSESVHKLWLSTFKKARSAPPLQDGLSRSARLLKEQADKCFEYAKGEGSLLFAWAGSTVMKGGAA